MEHQECCSVLDSTQYEEQWIIELKLLSLKLLVLSLRGSGEDLLLIMGMVTVLVCKMLTLILGNFCQTGVQSESEAWMLAVP